MSSEAGRGPQARSSLRPPGPGHDEVEMCKVALSLVSPGIITTVVADGVAESFVRPKIQPTQIPNPILHTRNQKQPYNSLQSAHSSATGVYIFNKFNSNALSQSRPMPCCCSSQMPHPGMSCSRLRSRITFQFFFMLSSSLLHWSLQLLS